MWALDSWVFIPGDQPVNLSWSKLGSSRDQQLVSPSPFRSAKAEPARPHLDRLLLEIALISHDLQALAARNKPGLWWSHNQTTLRHDVAICKTVRIQTIAEPVRNRAGNAYIEVQKFQFTDCVWDNKDHIRSKGRELAKVIIFSFCDF